MDTFNNQNNESITDNTYRDGVRVGAKAWVRAGIVLTLLMSALFFLYWDTAFSIGNIWASSSSFNHGFLILPISAYLIWERHQTLKQLIPEKASLAIVVLAVAVFFWLIGRITGTLIVQQFAFVAIIQSVVIGVVGWRVAGAMAFPLFYMVFAVPFGDFLVPSLQAFTARFVDLGLRLSGVPVFTDGVFISVTAGNFEVAEVCAGLRFLTATVALGVLCANFLYHSWVRRIAFLALSVVTPIVANGFRAYGIIMLAEFGDNDLSKYIDHITYGWVFFAMVTVVLLSIGMTFRDKTFEPEAVIPGSKVLPGAGINNSRMAAVIFGIGVFLVAASGPAFFAYSKSNYPQDVSVGLPAPQLGEPWVPVVSDNANWRPEYTGADAEVFQRYGAGELQVDQYIAYYAYQRDGAEAVGWNNKPDDGETWRHLGAGTIEAAIDGSPVQVRYTRMLYGPRRRIAWHWYWVDGRFTSDPRVAKFLQAKTFLFGGPSAAAAIVISAEYGESQSEAQEALANYVKSLPPLGELLERAAR